MKTDDPASIRFIEAVTSGDAPSVLSLLDGGVPATIELDDERELERARTPALYLACEKGHLPVVALLLRRGADPNAVHCRQSNIDTEKAPCLIAGLSSYAITEALLRAGADPNVGLFVREDAGWERSPLSMAPTPEIAALLRRYGAR